MPATESGFFGIPLAEHRFYRGCQASGTLIEFQSGFLEVGGGAFVGSPEKLAVLDHEHSRNSLARVTLLRVHRRGGRKT
jgi:hypothetical protein